MSTTRTESDTFGPIEVANDKYWGAQAQRSLGNFKIGWETQLAPIVRALGIVKRAAAESNMALGGLDEALGQRILVIDGAMGTMIQRHAPTEEDFRGDRFADVAESLQGADAQHDINEVTDVPGVLDDEGTQAAED